MSNHRSGVNHRPGNHRSGVNHRPSDDGSGVNNGSGDDGSGVNHRSGDDGSGVEILMFVRSSVRLFVSLMKTCLELSIFILKQSGSVPGQS